MSPMSSNKGGSQKPSGGRAIATRRICCRTTSWDGGRSEDSKVTGDGEGEGAVR